MLFRKNDKEKINNTEDIPEALPTDPTDDEYAHQGNRNSSFAKMLLKDILLCAVITCIILTFVSPTIVNQTSMLPTCQPGDYILLEKQAYLFKEPQRGDIIVFKSKIKNENGIMSKLLIKRIIAIPKDNIKIEGGQVYINGEKLDEKYLPLDTYTEGDIDRIIPEETYFVMGDNRDVSVDSRDSEVGLVSKKDIYGKALVRLLPLKNAGKVE